ncbi:MAG: DUF1320 domain-containing protein [Ignavibacteria bacterium]|nr:DUF1320 domain-containing protein [Ignavibacteria bacterium]
MPYTDKAYFLLKIKSEELERLTDDDDAILNSAIKSADSLIDTYLNNVLFNPPIFDVEGSGPEIIRQCSYDIAVFYLHDRIQYSEIPQWVKEKYNAAIDFLTKIAKGIISLDIETENTASHMYRKPDNNVQFFGSDTVMERGSF